MAKTTAMMLLMSSYKKGDKMAKKFKKVKGFQMNKKTGHPSKIISQRGKSVKSVGFTHNANDKASKKLLNHNINPNDTGKCYIKTTVEKQSYNDYKAKPEYKNFRIHSDDRQILIKIIKKDRG